MPPAKLLERMGQRFKLLTSAGGRRDRQATMVVLGIATLAWRMTRPVAHDDEEG